MAQIISERGVKGEMKVLPLSAKFQQLAPEATVHVITTDGDCRRHVIRSIRPLPRGAGISLYGIETPEESRAYRGAVIAVARDSLALHEGEYWNDDIIGLSVVTTTGELLGTVSDIIDTGGNDVYVVKSGEKEYLIPAITEVIREISLTRGLIIIKVIEGMLD